MLTTAPILDEPKELAQEADPEPPPRSEEERRAWYREGIESLREFRRTGLHITLDELKDWFDRLDTDPNAPPPKCHT